MRHQRGIVHGDKIFSSALAVVTVYREHIIINPTDKESTY